MWVSFSQVSRAWPETFVTGRNAPADRIQPGVSGHFRTATQQDKNKKMKRQIITLTLLLLCSLTFAQTDSVSIVKPTTQNAIEFENKINWEGIIALCAFVVSIVSIVFTIIQVQLQRTHNKKTVKPIGRIRIGDYQNNIYVKIENNGVGPLIVRQIQIKREKLQTTESFIDILPADLTKRITWTNFTGSYEGRTIIPGQSLELIVWTINDSYKKITDELERETIINQDRSDLRKSLKKVSVSITYTDIYEKEEFKQELTNKEFNDWYGRHGK
ncbi:MAG: hypothetical protein NWF06_11615 [Candidatus Bathyarchaeota archaeon]|nr:hypothetical protein [Candidatus Bathyarchaeum sp.]